MFQNNNNVVSNTQINNSIHFGFQQDTQMDNSLDEFKLRANNTQNECDAFANIFTTNLEDCLVEFDENNQVCEEMQEMIREAMDLPEGARERRLEEINQHIRFMKQKEAHKRILKEKNHRPFDDSNIGLCDLCFDDNFQIVFAFGVQYACKECVSKEMDGKNCTLYGMQQN